MITFTIANTHKKCINSSCNNWMSNHPRKALTIQDIPRIVKIALPLATTPSNIRAGFLKTGIWLLNENNLPDLQLMAIYVTDKSEKENT